MKATVLYRIASVCSLWQAQLTRTLSQDFGSFRSR